MNTAETLYYTEADYLTLEAEAAEKHEFWDGYVVALAGAELNHNRIKDELAFQLRSQLRAKGCEVVTSDQRVKAGRNYVYPDVVMFCGEPQLTGPRPTSLLNPTLLVEVLSESTAENDLSYKFNLYRRIQSLEEYWVVSSTRYFLTQHIREGETWRSLLYDSLEAELTSERLRVHIRLADIYLRVELLPKSLPKTH